MPFQSIRFFKSLTILAIVGFLGGALARGATVDVRPGDDIPSIVAANPTGTTFNIYPGTYRLQKPIVPKTGDRFIGQTACAPPNTSCPAILSGSRIIGPLAKFNGTNYEVTGQSQQGKALVPYQKQVLCDAGWQGCIYPEDLFFDGVPYKHLSSSTLPAIGPGQWWFDYTNNVIYFHDNPSGHTVETSVVNNAFGGPANNVTIQYLTLKEFANVQPIGVIGVSQDQNALTRETNWTVQNCEILLNHGFGVRVGYGIHVLNNYIHDNGQLGIGGGLGVTSYPSTQSTNSGILIQGNVINHNDYAHFNPNFGAGGIKIGSTSGVTIRRNTIQRNEGSGIHFDNQSTNEVVDGNTITDNSDSDGVNQEIGYGTSKFRNNVILRNGVQVNNNYFSDQIRVSNSAGVESYCNVLEAPSGKGIGTWGIGSANFRGYNPYPPYQYLTSFGNSFHHNTVIFDSGSTAVTGFNQGDTANQPAFFVKNSQPDHNQYHVSNTGVVLFKYDNNNSGSNLLKSFPHYQASTGTSPTGVTTGPETHSTIDAHYNAGFPTVAITSPMDQSALANLLTVTATASDNSGIDRVELYVDWQLEATAQAAPFAFNSINVSSLSTGSHIVTAMAYSNAGVRNCYAVTLNKQ